MNQTDLQSKLSILFVFCVLIIGLGDAATALSDEHCITPDQSHGKCIQLQECKALVNKVHGTNADREFLRRSQCGFFGLHPLVCCPMLRLNPRHSNVSNFPAPGICGIHTEDSRIPLDGESTNILSHPWLALIQYAKFGKINKFLCGGSLINENYVLTAANCLIGGSVFKSGWSAISVRLGENDLRVTMDCDDELCADPVIDVAISEVITYEEYDSNSAPPTDDIALIRLLHSVTFTDWVRPICLPFASHLKNKNFDKTVFYVSGFGIIENGTLSNIKMMMNLSGYNSSECNITYNRIGTSLTSKHLCAGGAEGNSVSDAGGPLMAHETLDDNLGSYIYLAGIASSGYRGVRGFPGIYTRVDRYLNWIASHVKP